MAGFHSCDIFGCTFGDNRAAPVTAFWTEIDQPVSCLDDVKVVFDDEHSVSLVDESRQDDQEAAHVFKMESSRRLIEQVDGVARAAPSQFGCQFHALCFTTRERWS